MGLAVLLLSLLRCPSSIEEDIFRVVLVEGVLEVQGRRKRDVRIYLVVLWIDAQTGASHDQSLADNEGSSLRVVTD